MTGWVDTETLPPALVDLNDPTGLSGAGFRLAGTVVLANLDDLTFELASDPDEDFDPTADPTAPSYGQDLRAAVARAREAGEIR